MAELIYIIQRMEHPLYEMLLLYSAYFECMSQFLATDLIDMQQTVAGVSTEARGRRVLSTSSD